MGRCGLLLVEGSEDFLGVGSLPIDIAQRFGRLLESAHSTLPEPPIVLGTGQGSLNSLDRIASK